MTLFHAQVHTKAQNRLHGDIFIARPMSFSVLTLLFVALACSLVAFFVTFGYTRKVQVGGIVTPKGGIARVVAAQSGAVLERLVEEGQIVQIGDALFTLSSERTSTTWGDTEATVGSLLQSRRKTLLTEQAEAASQGSRRGAALFKRTEDLAAEVGRIDDQIALQVRRLAIAREAAARYDRLAEVKFVSKALAEEKAAEMLDQEQRMGDLARAKASVQRDLATARADWQDHDSQVRRSQLAVQRNIAAIEQDLAESEVRRQFVVRAPRAGQIAAITVEAGQPVVSGQPLASLIPGDAVMEVELFAPSRAIGFVRPGLPVLIRFEAFPYQKFGQHGALVREVSRTALRTDELPVPLRSTQAQAGELVYRVRASLNQPTVLAYGVEQPLKPGMTLDASIVLEERRFYEWMLEPLLTITGRL